MCSISSAQARGAACDQAHSTIAMAVTENRQEGVISRIQLSLDEKKAGRACITGNSEATRCFRLPTKIVLATRRPILFELWDYRVRKATM